MISPILVPNYWKNNTNNNDKSDASTSLLKKIKTNDGYNNDSSSSYNLLINITDIINYNDDNLDLYINLPTSDTKITMNVMMYWYPITNYHLKPIKKHYQSMIKTIKKKVTGKYYVIKQNEVVILLFKKLKEIIWILVKKGLWLYQLK